VAGLGLQMALSQRTASGRGSLAEDFCTVRTMLTVSGSGICLLSFVLAPFLIAHFVPDQRIYDCFISILPAILIISLAAAYRGYFRGNGKYPS